MEKAFSLIKHKLVPAEIAEYRQNLEEQLVCPTCSEPVFKKKLWVVSRQLHTHFFSHYFGDQDSCEERTKGEGNYENSRDHYAQLQRLEVFNKCFRENITTAFTKIVGKQVSNKLTSALEYSERLCRNEIDSKELEKLELNLINSLEAPITQTINEKLEDLEDALIHIYNHLAGSHGQPNLRFITCLCLLLSFLKESEHLEDILKSKVLKTKLNLDALLLGNSVLILSNSDYVDWHGSKKPILEFLNPSIKTTPVKKKLIAKGEVRSSKETFGYFACIYCKAIQHFEFNKYKECSACHKWFYTDPKIKLKNLKGLEHDTPESQKSKDPRWIYCMQCNKHYFAEPNTPCPHFIQQGKLPSRPKNTKPVVKELIKCAKCKANYFGIKNSCPYCLSTQSTKFKKCRGCDKNLIKDVLLPSKAGLLWRKCNFCNLNFELKNF